mmetsp:Transcript_19078/g.47169  ORF Transcript_19078/g.47169 Transcript_19078/m.47169 type:complete len:380 (-) Transcript_19078:151-1290(-)
MFRDDQRSRRGDAISSHKRRYCVCGGFLTLSAFLTTLVRIVNLLLAVFVAKTVDLLAVRFFTSALAFYQLVCLMIQWRREERANPNTSLYEFTKSQHETIKMILAASVGVIMALCLPYLAYFTEETQWRHAGGGVLLFVFPAILDYRIRRSLKYLFGIRPEIKNDDDNEIDFVLTFLWIGKYVQMPVELGPAIAYALLGEEKQYHFGPELSWIGPRGILISTLVFTIGLILAGVFSRITPGICWISSDGKVQIPVNASEAGLSYAGYLAALCDERVVYVAAGDVAKDIPMILRWITYSGLPEAGRWGEVMGHGDAETGAELRVEKCFGKSILYDNHMGSLYIQLGDRVFETHGGYMEETPSTLKILDHATPVNGCWEII